MGDILKTILTIIINKQTPVRSWLAFLSVVWILSSGFGFNVGFTTAMASTTKQPPSLQCQQATQNLRVYFQTEKAIRDDVVIVSKLDQLSQIKINLAYLGIKRELLSLAKKGILHQCNFSELEDAGLSIQVSDDGRLYLYYWISDYEIPESLGYTYVMYVPPKNPDFHTAEYNNHTNYIELAQLITIPKPENLSTDSSMSSNVNFPVYALIYRQYLRGNHRIDCHPYIEFHPIKQNKSLTAMMPSYFRLLDTKGNPINQSQFFINGCNGEDPNTQYQLDNQFRYDADTQVLSFRLAVLSNNDNQTGVSHYTQQPYQFWFSGKDFIQIINPATANK